MRRGVDRGDELSANNFEQSQVVVAPERLMIFTAARVMRVIFCDLSRAEEVRAPRGAPGHFRRARLSFRGGSNPGRTSRATYPPAAEAPRLGLGIVRASPTLSSWSWLSSEAVALSGKCAGRLSALRRPARARASPRS